MAVKETYLYIVNIITSGYLIQTSKPYEEFVKFCATPGFVMLECQRDKTIFQRSLNLSMAHEIMPQVDVPGNDRVYKIKNEK